MKKIKLATPVTWQGIDEKEQLSYSDSIISLGSCFSQRIGDWLAEHSFNVCSNPFGTLYNPISLARAIEILCDEDRFFSKEDLVQHNNLWHSFMHYSYYSGQEPEQVLDKINTDLKRGRQVLLSGNWLLLTLGSSYIYRYRKSGEVVANCHKIPDKEFEHSRLSMEEAYERLSGALENLFSQNEKLRLIVTVSPIRYLRYSATENSRSKASLLLLADRIEKQFPSRVSYFPAYEIMMDELRDYRFYADDLIHPTSLAVEIIRQHLLEGWLRKDQWDLLKAEVKRVKQAAHREILPNLSR